MMTAETMMAEARTAQTAGDLLRSAQILEALLRRWPDHPQALNMLGTILLNRGSVQRAREVLERATKADPAVAPIWLNLARAQRQLEEFAGERLSLAAALDCNPYLLIAHVRKAELHARLGEEADAVAAWQSVLTLCRADPQPSDAVMRLVEQAEAYVEPRTARMTAELQLGLKSARADLPQAATRRFDVAVGHAMGTRPIYGSKSSGLHFPFLPAEEFFDRNFFFLAGRSGGRKGRHSFGVGKCLGLPWAGFRALCRTGEGCRAEYLERT